MQRLRHEVAKHVSTSHGGWSREWMLRPDRDSLQRLQCSDCAAGLRGRAAFPHEACLRDGLWPGLEKYSSVFKQELDSSYL